MKISPMSPDSRAKYTSVSKSKPQIKKSLLACACHNRLNDQPLIGKLARAPLFWGGQRERQKSAVIKPNVTRLLSQKSLFTSSYPSYLFLTLSATCDSLTCRFIDLLQVDLLASGARLVWPRSGRPRATKSRELRPAPYEIRRRTFLKVQQIHYALFLALFQNWVAYQTLEKAAELNITQQRINFENDDVLPKPGYHNAFCQVRNSLHQLCKERDLNLNMN